MATLLRSEFKFRCYDETVSRDHRNGKCNDGVVVVAKGGCEEGARRGGMGWLFVCNIRRELILTVMLNHDVPSYIEVHLLKRSTEGHISTLTICDPRKPAARLKQLVYHNTSAC